MDANVMRLAAAIIVLLLVGNAYPEGPKSKPTPLATSGTAATPEDKSKQFYAPEASPESHGAITQNAPISINFGSSEGRDGKESLAEWFTAFGTLGLVGVTGALFIATFFLFRSTSRLVKETKKTAKKQLRAYVALDDIYFPWKPNNADPSDRTDIIPERRAKV